tara:strand:- start:3074 stop:4153 length:1080 start_codon:yes stop_codon:yes gene_type:complete
MGVAMGILLLLCCCICSYLLSCTLSSGYVFFKSKPPVELILSEDSHYQAQPVIINKVQYFEYMAQYKTDQIRLSEIKYKEFPGNRRAVLWIHGFNDYYFHFHVGELLLSEGYNVYSITLPKYPQNGTDRRYLFYTSDIGGYFPYIDDYIDFINKRDIHDIVLYGHSTGGLITTAYLSEGKNASKISKLILNAPFFDFNDSDLKEFILESIISTIGKFAPKFLVKEGKNKLHNPDYYKDILSRYYFEQNKKLTYPSHVFAGWIRAVSIYHKKIQKKQIKLRIPVLVLTSSTSMRRCSGEQKGDCVLDVIEMKRISKNIGDDVRVKDYHGAIHDVLLSKSGVVDLATRDMLHFLRNSQHNR